MQTFRPSDIYLYMTRAVKYRPVQSQDSLTQTYVLVLCMIRTIGRDLYTIRAVRYNLIKEHVVSFRIVQFQGSQALTCIVIDLYRTRVIINLYKTRAFRYKLVQNKGIYVYTCIGVGQLSRDLYRRHEKIWTNKQLVKQTN